MFIRLHAQEDEFDSHEAYLELPKGFNLKRALEQFPSPQSQDPHGNLRALIDYLVQTYTGVREIVPGHTVEVDYEGLELWTQNSPGGGTYLIEEWDGSNWQARQFP